MTSEQANNLKLEIWREIMRARGETVYGGGGSGMSSMVAPNQYKEPPNPTDCAKKANAAFEALFAPPKPKRQAR